MPIKPTISFKRRFSVGISTRTQISPVRGKDGAAVSAARALTREAKSKTDQQHVDYTKCARAEDEDFTHVFPEATRGIRRRGCADRICAAKLSLVHYLFLLLALLHGVGILLAEIVAGQHGD